MYCDDCTCKEDCGLIEALDRLLDFIIDVNHQEEIRAIVAKDVNNCVFKE